MKLVFVKRQKQADDAYSFFFKPKRKFLWWAGQYLFYTIPNDNPDERGVTRYFTISSAPFEKHIAITTRIFENSSTFKKSLMKLKTGDEIEASGPDGDFVVNSDLIGVNNLKRSLVFIAGGIGITPFRSILAESAHNGQILNVQLLYANKNENIVFKDELESLKNKTSNLKINYFISPASTRTLVGRDGPAHIDAQSIEKLITNNKLTNNPFFYISGPSNFVRAIRDIVKSQGVPNESIKLDFFSGYS